MTRGNEVEGVKAAVAAWVEFYAVDLAARGLLSGARLEPELRRALVAVLREDDAPVVEPTTDED